MYFYKCQAIRVIDGDTVELSIDLGLHIKARQVVRLAGINAPEIKGETLRKGEATKRRLAELIEGADEELCCRTYLDRDDKFGRLLVSLYPHQGAATSFNEVLLNEKLAVPFMQERL